MMSNTLKYLHVGLVKVEGKFFSDHDKISSWAVEDINSMFISGVINIAGNQFNPQSNLTHDQLFVMVSDLDTFLQAVGVKYRTGVQQVVETPMQAQKEVKPTTTKVEETKAVEEPQWLTFNNVTINIGDTQETVESKIGKADRKGASQFNFEWNIYNSDPTMLTMIGYIDNKVAGIYHMSKVFTSSYGNYGDVDKWQSSGALTIRPKLKFVDTEDGNKVYGVMFISDAVKWDSDEEAVNNFNDFAKNQLEVVNVFRNWNNVQPLIWDDSLAAVAQAHSQDMVDRNFYSHTTPDGITVDDRIKANTKFKSAAENIAQEYLRNTVYDGFWIVNRWICSEGHRKNILNTSLHYFGAGYAAKPEINNVYSTQNFTR